MASPVKLVTRAVFWLTAIQASATLSQEIIVAPLSTSKFSPGASIPGGSDFKYCNVSRETDLYSIEHMEVYPTPPIIDEYITIQIYGTFLKTITPDPTWAYVLNVTDINNVTGRIAETFRFCDGLQVIEQPNGRKNTCPPEKGGGMISVLAYVLSGEFEPGDYSLRIDAKTQEDERIYCIHADFFMDYAESERARDVTKVELRK